MAKKSPLSKPVEIKGIEAYKRINKSDIPNGQHHGVWCGDTATITINRITYTIKTEAGVRGNVGCIVKVSGNKVTVAQCDHTEVCV